MSGTRAEGPRARKPVENDVCILYVFRMYLVRISAGVPLARAQRPCRGRDGGEFHHAGQKIGQLAAAERKDDPDARGLGRWGAGLNRDAEEQRNCSDARSDRDGDLCHAAILLRRAGVIRQQNCQRSPKLPA